MLRTGGCRRLRPAGQRERGRKKAGTWGPSWGSRESWRSPGEAWALLTSFLCGGGVRALGDHHRGQLGASCHACGTEQHTVSSSTISALVPRRIAAAQKGGGQHPLKTESLGRGHSEGLPRGSEPPPRHSGLGPGAKETPEAPELGELLETASLPASATCRDLSIKLSAFWYPSDLRWLPGMPCPRSIYAGGDAAVKLKLSPLTVL